MRIHRTLAIIGCSLLAFAAVSADDLLGKGKGGGGGGGSQSGGSGGSGGSGRDQGSGGNRGGGGGNPDRGSRGNGGDRPSNNRDRSNNDSRGDDRLLGRSESRSGRVNYGSVNNVGNGNLRGRVERITIDRTPVDLRAGSLENQVRREDRGRLVNNGYRYGYYGYDSRWRDDDFCYPHYRFDPYGRDVLVSPWYYYPHLPGYFVGSRVTAFNIQITNFSGDRYNWRSSYDDWGWSNRSNHRDRELDGALDDLIDAFEYGDRRAANRLLPRRGTIGIFVDGRYSYAVSADDFADMFQDAIRTTRTQRYEVADVWRNRDGAQVLARHMYTDPWGRRAEVWHRYVLRYDRSDLVIREFGITSWRP